MFFGNRGNTSNDTEYYDELGIDKTADENQIKKAYRKMAMKWHPDRNKNNPKEAEIKFKKVSEAYSVLSDSEKRQTYDRFGKEALGGAAGGGGGVNPFDIFGSMFGDDNDSPFGGMGGPFGSMFGGGRSREPTIEPLVVVVECTLEEVYQGTKKKVDFERTLQCKHCKGIGATDKSNIDVCPKCKGKGKVTVVNQIGPGMLSQSTCVCDKCNGKGTIIAAGMECKMCSGEGVSTKKCRIELDIDRGIENNHKIQFEKQGNQNKEGKQGDLVFIIKIKDHEVFERQGNNLRMKKTIKLSEALTGVEMIIKRLCGKPMVVRTRSSDILVPDSKRVIHGMGMPIPNSRLCGDLIINFNLEFPTEISSEYRAYLRKLLPSPEKLNIDKSKVKIYKLEKIREQERAEYQSDEDELHPRFPGHAGFAGPPGMGQAVECAQQ